MDVRNAKCTNNNCELLEKLEKCEDNTCVKYAYIRLSQFGDNTNSEWVGLVRGLSDQINKDKNIKGIVFDLRNNPGGYLTDATFITSEFIKKGLVVVSQDSGVNQEKMLAARDGLLLNPKLVVLINKGSASASEIVAGALRDHKRATLVGETSFGKGTIQQAEDLGDGAGLHVTIAKWLTPNGIWVNGNGLTPDVSVKLDAKDPSRDTQLEKAVQELLK
jgi:carboxyl-terminal processing protease